MALVAHHPATKGSPITTPAAFSFSKSAGGATIDTFNCGQIDPDIQFKYFAPLLSAVPLDGFNTQVSPKKFLQNIDLDTPYKNRVVPLFQNFITAQIINNQNSFWTTVVAPCWETPEQNFTVNRTEFNAITYTEIAEFGIPDQQTKFSYGWTDSTRRFALSSKISRDLANDPNFGAGIWMEEMAAFVDNANYTTNLNVALACVQIGYSNRLGLSPTESRIPDTSALYEYESQEIFPFCMHPDDALDRIMMSVERKIPNFNLIIGPSSSSRYFPNAPSSHLEGQRLFMKPDAPGRVHIERFPGQLSYKSFSRGNRVVGMVEGRAFRMNSQDTFEIDPLKATTTICQYYPPNANLSPYDPVNSTNPSYLDRFINYQTKTAGEDRRIKMRDMLTNCNYWDPVTGEVSETSRAYANYITHRIKSGDTDCIPYDWNPTYGNTHGDINRESTNNDTPLMKDVDGKTDVLDMTSWRNKPPGFLYNPVTQTMGIPEHMGDYHQKDLSNAWIYHAAKHLTLKAEEVIGISDLDDKFMRFKKFNDRMDSARVTRPYLEAFINKNIKRLIGPDGQIRTAKTPQSKKSKNRYPNINLIDEWVGNYLGGMDLPERNASIQENYPGLFNNGIGYQILALEALNPASLYHQAGKEAAEQVDFARFLLSFNKQYVGDTNCINPDLTAPWNGIDSALTVLLDYMIQPGAPVFVGVPRKVTHVEDPEEGTRIVLDDMLLDRTLTQTKDKIKKAVEDEEIHLVTNKERAFSCLSNDAFQKISDLLANIKTLDDKNSRLIAEFTPILHTLCDYIMSFCNYAGANILAAKQIQASSIIMEAFVERVLENVVKRNEDGTYDFSNWRVISNDAAGGDNAAKEKLVEIKKSILKEGTTFAQNFTNNTKAAKMFAELKKGKPVATVAEETFFKELKDYEKVLVNFEQEKVGSDKRGDYAEIPKRNGYEGDFSVDPLRYLRTPLTSTRGLEALLEEFSTSTPWALPGDSNLNYELPEEARVMTSDRTMKVNPHPFNSLARSLQIQTAVFSSRDNNNNNNRDDSSESSDDDDNQMRFQPTRKPFSVNRLLSVGRGYDEDDSNDSRSKKSGSRKLRGRGAKAVIDPEEAFAEASQKIYAGPWEPRIRFCEDEIQRESDKFYFMVIAEAKNTLKTPVRLTECGASLFDVMLVRPFIEFEAHALIAMESGAGTIMLTVSHSSVTVARESRGIFHINCNFVMGIVRMNPDNIYLYANAFPHKFLGGKKVDFMTNFDNWDLDNPAKESIIAFLLSKDERRFGSPMSLTNGRTFIRPGVDEAIWERKCSAFGSYYEFLTKDHNPRSIDALQALRTVYNSNNVKVSHVAHLGPTGYIDPLTGKKIYYEGCGPSGERRMNIPGAQHTWEARTARFPALDLDYDRVTL